MAAVFTCDEKVTVERRTVERDPVYGTKIKDAWVVVANGYWANVQDVLPSRGESTDNGLRVAVKRTRLRMRKFDLREEDRITLHGHSERVMRIVSGPAMLDDRVHIECMLEADARG